MNAPPGQPLGVVAHYNLLERIDQAGPGELYRARDTRAGRTVAVRLLPLSFGAPDDDVIARTQPLLSVSHPNIVTVFGVGEHGGGVYLAFEFVRGQSIRAEMAGRPMNVRRAVELGIQIADAVAEAHARGFVHGGLSPDSIVVSAKGHAKIPASDLAAHVGFDQTSQGSRLHDYPAPEEGQGRPPDDRTDVYSIGAVIFDMLTMRPPHPKGTASPSASHPLVPPELDEVLLRALSPNPESRYQDAATLAADLRRVMTVLDARNIPGDDEPALPPSRTGAGVAILVAVLILGLLVWWFTRS